MSKGRVRASHADFIGISRKVANSPAFMALPPIARALYVDLRRQYNGYNNGQIAAVMEGTADRPGLASYGWPRRSVFKNINVLIEHHLIERTRQGGIGALSKTCSLYAFTDLLVVANREKGIHGSMASLAYLNFTPKAKERRTRKQSQGARGARIGARGARTYGHAVPSQAPIGARGAPCELPSKVTQAIDDTTKSGNSAMESEKAPYGHAVHPLISLPRGGGVLDSVIDVELGGSGARQKIAPPEQSAATPAPKLIECTTEAYRARRG